MKRKRGHKKGSKTKGPVLVAEPAHGASDEAIVNVSSQNSEYNSGNPDDLDNNEYESGMEVDSPSSTGTDQPLNVASINPDGSVDKAVGKSIGRVKVKLKTSKLLDSDVPSHSDTDKSSPPMGLERQGLVAEKIEDSDNSLSEMKVSGLGDVSKKAGSIKIKSSRSLSGSSVDKNISAVAPKDETSLQQELKAHHQNSRYNKEELDASLMVIKKVMKMDAAEPFNAPVNPVALGIPDYFDVIDTPMDFGTICSNLESGCKYKNSANVYKDVQYIWENCCKYNNKGDYIVDLMRRVKKNFMKYWTAAGLYNEQSRGVDNAQMEDAAQSSQGKVHLKSGQSKAKAQKRHGRRHKNDCLCAICVLKRRKREREENARIAKGLTGVQEVKQEESSIIESHSGEDSSLNMAESLNLDADADVEGNAEEEKPENDQQYSFMEEKLMEEEEEDEEEPNEINMEKKINIETKDNSQLGDRLGEEPNRQPLPGTVGKSAEVGQTQIATMQQQKQKLQESRERQQKVKMYESFHFENPALLSLCRTLFPANNNSVWSGPHSLVQYHVSAGTNSINAAIETLMSSRSSFD